MAEMKEIPPGTYELQLGATFDRNNREKTTFHTLRYDFKPKSVAAETETYVAMGANGDVQVAVPGEGDSLTVFKGAAKAVKADKECLLFFDSATGQVRLEKISSNISVKKTRDIDGATEQVLRSAIPRLRNGFKGSSSSSAQNPDQGHSKSKDKVAEKTTAPSSSSSSGSSSDTDSDDDKSDAPHSPRPLRSASPPPPPSPPPQRARKHSSEMDSSGGESSDDDAVMQRHLGMVSDQKMKPADRPHTASVLNDLELSESSDDD